MGDMLSDREREEIERRREAGELTGAGEADWEGIFGGVWATIRGFFQEQFRQVWEDYSIRFPNLITQATRSVAEWFGDEIGDGLLHTFNIFKEMGMLDDNDISNLQTYFKGWGVFNYPVQIAYSFLLLFTAMKIKMTVLSGTLQQELNKQYSPYPAPAESLLRGLFIAPEKTAEIRDRMRANGYSDQDIDLLILSQYATYGVGEIRDLYLRGELTDEEMVVRMRELGFTDTRTQELVKIWSLIPGAGDLITMAFKGSFDPVNKQKWPWAFDAPGGFVEWGAKLGITKEWAERYWYMHWVQPGVREMFEMFHRGAITDEDLSHTLKVSGYSDYWIDRLKVITYQVLTRVDTRRMHDLGVLDSEGLMQVYMEQGYGPENARLMTEWTIQYNAQNDRDLSKTEIIKGWQLGGYDRKTVIELLVGLGYTQTRAEFVITLEEMKYDNNTQEMLVDSVHDRYIERMIDKKEALQRLNEINIHSDRIGVMLDQWEVDRWKKAAMHSKTDLEKMYRAKIVDEQTFRWEMEKLGYNFVQIERYVKLLKGTKK